MRSAKQILEKIVDSATVATVINFGVFRSRFLEFWFPGCFALVDALM